MTTIDDMRRELIQQGESKLVRLSTPSLMLISKLEERIAKVKGKRPRLRMVLLEILLRAMTLDELIEKIEKGLKVPTDEYALRVINDLRRLEKRKPI